MNDLKIDPALRLFLAVVATMIWLGVWLTGFGTAHWIFYIPGVLLMLAAVTGLCPGIYISRMVMGKQGG
jgi:hypothetical protein